MTRPSWDDYFFGIAAHVASRATCPRASIGCVLVKSKKIIGTGYNGVAEGEPHCPDTLEHLALDHCQAAIHAEYNALANALVPAFGATLYCVGPRRICPDCADRLHENGVTDIRWRPSVLTLDNVLRDVTAWQQATFGHETIEGATAHLQEELRELWERPDNAEEMADVVMLLSATTRLRGIDLAAEIASKLAICRTRVWAEPDADGKIKAIKVTGP